MSYLASRSLFKNRLAGAPREPIGVSAADIAANLSLEAGN